MIWAGVTLPPLAKLSYMNVETAKRTLARRRRDEEIHRAERKEDERRLDELIRRLLRWDRESKQL